jgi:hypothetical protein
MTSTFLRHAFRWVGGIQFFNFCNILSSFIKA